MIFWLPASPFPSIPPKVRSPPHILTKIEATYKRKIKKITSLATLDDQSTFYIIEFTVKNDSALAVLALVKNTGTILFRNYPAQYNAKSTWSVHDRGHFDAKHYQLIAVLEDRNNMLEVFTEWAGAESTILDYMQQKRNLFTSVKTATRYTAPL